METVHLDLTDTQYIDISGTNANVYIQTRGRPIRVHAGASLPNANTDAYILLSNQDEHFPISGISSTDKVYARADSGISSIAIIRGS